MRVLIISDDPCSHSGFGSVIRHLFGTMHDHPSIDLVAIGLFPQDRELARPVRTIRAQSKYGLGDLERIVEREGWPDVIFLLGDWWYWKDDLLNAQWKKLNNCLSSIWYYAPWDGVPISDAARPHLQSADRLIAMSPFGLDILSRYTDRQVDYMPHGYDPSVFSHIERHIDGPVTLGVVARNARRKHLSTIIQAYWSLPQELDARLLLHVPDDDHAGGMLQNWLISRWQGKPPVEWTGQIKMPVVDKCKSVRGVYDHDMPDIYRRMDILVSAGREGFGLPYLEGRVCGCRLVLPCYSAHFSMDYPEAVTYAVAETCPEPGGHDIIEILPSVEEVAGAMKVAIELHRDGSVDPYAPEHLQWPRISAKLEKELLAHGESRGNRFARAVKTPTEDRPGWCGLVVPGDLGDVLLCTAVANSLKNRHEKLVFVTREQNFEILEGCPWIDEVREYNPMLHDNYSRMCRHYDAWYTPHFATQVAANWVHGGHGRSLAETYAAHCNCGLGDYWVACVEPGQEARHMLPCEHVTIHTGSGKGRHALRRYDRWPEVCALLHERGYSTVQIGGKDDIDAGVDVDLRGQTTLRETMWVLNSAYAHVGIDSMPMHAAIISKVPTVALFANTMPDATGPDARFRGYLTAIEPDRPHCRRACHSFSCAVGKPCIRSIDPRTIAEAVK